MQRMSSVVHSTTIPNVGTPTPGDETFPGPFALASLERDDGTTVWLGEIAGVWRGLGLVTRCRQAAPASGNHLEIVLTQNILFSII